jgi:quercetin dioxygenase-like cupin family protein
MIHRKLNTIESAQQNAGRGVSMQMLLSLQDVPNFAMRCFTIAAGGFMPHHTNSVEHEQFVLSGQAKVRVGDETFDAVAGDVLFIPAGVAHSYETAGDEAYVFLCLIPKGEDCIEIVGC